MKLLIGLSILFFGFFANASYIIPNGSVTRPKLAPVGQVVSAGCASCSATSATFADTLMTLSITTTGRPVSLRLGTNSAGSAADILAVCTTPICTACFQVIRDTSTNVGRYCVGGSAGGSTSTAVEVPGSSINFLDLDVAAGTHTYKVQSALVTGTGSLGAGAIANNTVLIAFEM